MPPDLGRVVALTRYPVKSFAGEALTSAHLGARGVDGDRSWAVRTGAGGIGSGKDTRRFRRVDGLLGLSAVLDGAAPVVTAPVVTVPDGRRAVAGTRGRCSGSPPMLAVMGGGTPGSCWLPERSAAEAALLELRQALGLPVEERVGASAPSG